MIDRRTIDKIMDTADIVDVVSDFVTLQKRGTSYKGLCPFHDDTTPSFSVSPSRGVFKCFACGKAGNALSFVMEHEQMTYAEALKYLAKKYNIEVEERELTPEERTAQDNRDGMFIVNEWAAKFFHHTLLDSSDGKTYGLQYLRSRGIRDDIIEKFCLGYAPRSRNATGTQALKEGYKADFLVQTGLCYERDMSNTADNTTTQPAGEGHRHLADRFAGRVIFPWQGVSGKVVAFGGRLLDSRTKGVVQKYVNSPDSEIYHKDHELYGIFQAKKAISKEDKVFMVEGYTDVIAMHQCGIENVVANSGTALSFHQIRLLRRFTNNITLLYDGDEAGIHAAMRGTDMLLEEGMRVRVMLLPDNEDPDSFARKHTATQFREYIEEHEQDFLVFKTTHLLQGVNDPMKRSEAISDIVRSIAVIRDPIVRDTYVKECSNRIGIDELTLIVQMNKFISNNIEYKKRERERRNNQQQSASTTAATPAPRPSSPTTLQPLPLPTKESTAEALEQRLIETIVRYGEKVIFHSAGEDTVSGNDTLTLAQYVSESLNEDGLSFSSPIYNAMLAEAVEMCRKRDFRSETYFTHHPDINISRLAAQLSVENHVLSKSLQRDVTEEHLRRLVDHLLLDFRLLYVNTRLLELQKSINAYDDDARQLQKALTEITRLQRLRNEIAKRLGRNVVG